MSETTPPRRRTGLAVVLIVLGGLVVLSNLAAFMGGSLAQEDGAIMFGRVLGIVLFGLGPIVFGLRILRR